MKGQYANIINLAIGLVVIFGIMAAISPKGPDGFPILLGKSNLVVMLGFCTFNILLGTGMTFAILAGGIDLSVGRCLALSNVMFAIVLNAAHRLVLGTTSSVVMGMSLSFLATIVTTLIVLKASRSLISKGVTSAIVEVGIRLALPMVISLFVGVNTFFIALRFPLSAALFLAAAAAIFVGGLTGLLNGLISVKGRIPSFIATLGTYMVCWGLAYVLSSGETITTNAEIMRRPFVGAWIPLAPVIVPVMAVVLAHVLLTDFKFGRFVYAVGGNVEAARLSGIAVDRIRILAFVICGSCAGIGGIIYWAKLGTGSSLAGEAFELYAIAAVIIGGTSLSGGEGTVIGTFLGALIMGVLREGLVIREVSEHWQKVVFGAVIIAAVLFDSLRRRRRD